MDEEEEGDEMIIIIKYTIDHILQNDKQELAELLIELRYEVREEYLDIVNILLLLVGQYVIKEFNDDGEPLSPMIEEKRLALQTSSTSPAKLLRLKILLDDINSNRHRIKERKFPTDRRCKR